MDLYTYIYNNIPKGWEDLFKVAEPEIKQISDLLEKEKNKGYRIVPNQENIFRVFELCKPEDIKVIIVGQDCYHQLLTNGTPRALGFSFSVSKDDVIPSSLHNIYKEIKNCYPSSIIPNHGDLMDWVNQGVFLLNMSLTCRVNEPNSHSKYNLWLPFMDRFLKYLSSINKDAIFVLWGKEAQKLDTPIEKGFRHILKGVHPSGLSANRGFFGCNHFKMINDILVSKNKKPIHWLEQELTLQELYMKYFIQNVPKSIVDTLAPHYQSYYNESSKNVSIEEFCIEMLLKGMHQQKATDISYDEYLKQVKDKFSSKENLDDNKFYSCL